MARYLVTGGMGFIGSNLVRALVQRGDMVDVIDVMEAHLPYGVGLKNHNRQQIMSMAQGRVRHAKCDIQDIAMLRQVTEGEHYDAVIHLAALAGVRPSMEYPDHYESTNITGTRRMLQLAASTGIKNFILASSSSVYGNNQEVPFSESHRVDNPISYYAWTKKSNEELCYQFHHNHEMNVTCLRFFTVYGPSGRPDLAIPKFTRLIHAGKKIPVYGDGSKTRDFTHVDDIVAGVLAAIDRCGEFGGGYRIYNLGCGATEPTSVLRLVELISGALGKVADIDWTDPPAGDVERTWADVSLIQEELGYNPTTQIEEGIPLYIEWFKRQIEQGLPVE